MGDAAARREARRKRILENSESRLQRISGRREHDDRPEGDLEEKFSKETLAPDTLSSGSGLIHNAFCDKPSGRFLQADKPDEIVEKSLPSFQSDDSFRESSSTLRRRTFTADITTEDRNEDEPTADERNEDTVEMEKERKPQTSLFSKFFMSRYIYVLLAGFVNILIFSKLGYLMGKAMVIPYFSTTLGRLFYFVRKQRTSNGADYVSMALMLCKIRPEVIFKMKTAVIACDMILKDLALYIFSFVLINCILMWWWNDFDIPDVSEYKSQLYSHSDVDADKNHFLCNLYDYVKALFPHV